MRTNSCKRDRTAATVSTNSCRSYLVYSRPARCTARPTVGQSNHSKTTCSNLAHYHWKSKSRLRTRGRDLVPLITTRVPSARIYTCRVPSRLKYGDHTMHGEPLSLAGHTNFSRTEVGGVMGRREKFPPPHHPAHFRT